jgi:signal transduction histidine kinase
LAPVNAQQLRRAVVSYAIVAMAAISLVVAAIAIAPLAARLRDGARAGLDHDLALKVAAGGQALARARNLAEQVTSRTVIRERLEMYNRGATTLPALTEFTRDKLADALNLSAELLGISRFAAQGEPVVSVGAFAEDGPLSTATTTTTMLGLRRQDGRSHLVVAAPIRSRDGTFAGTDVAVVDASGLQAVVDDAGAIGRTSWAGVVEVAGAPRPLMVSGDTFSMPDGADSVAAAAVSAGRMVRQEKAGLILAAAPLPNSNWALVLAMAAGEATRDVDRLLAWVVLAAVVATSLGVGGLVMVLRPLTGAFLVHASDMARQIDELERAKAELAAKSHSLARSNADLQEYAYAASHDLQEPVRTIVGFSQLLKRRYGGQLGPEADEFIGFIVEGAERMRRQINDLLAYARLDHGEVLLEPVSMDEVVDEALGALADAIAKCDAEVVRRPLPDVRGRRDSLVRLMQNLVANSLKFAAKGERPRIDISGHVVDGWAELMVRDHGIGIEPQYHERIFRMFERLEPGQYPGSGIGLAICRKVADMHGGRIWVDSARGAGASFHIRLPAA